jgi:MoxR-like ATPase
VLAGKARAVLHGRCHVSREDIRAVTHPVLRHRIITNFNADAEGTSSERIIDRLLEDVPEDHTPSLDAAGARAVLRTAVGPRLERG